MTIEVASITDAQMRRILNLEEGHFSDVKALEIAPAKLTRHVSAFANADGGELYIGIDEVRPPKLRSWRGFANPESANGHIQIFEKLFPLGQDFSYTFLQTSGAPGLVLQVIVLKTREIKEASDGKVYIRRGAQSIPIETAEELERLKLNKGITSFETETVGIDLSLVTNSISVIGFMIEVVPTSEPETWLRKQQIIRENKPTVACILLFADEPQVAIPKRCALKIYRYQTSEAVGTRETLAFNPVTIEGSVYEQIRSAVDKTREILEQLTVLTPDGMAKVNYPTEALHEIITNAVLHRDYSLADDIHIRIFENRVEVQSPGRLPAHITENNILEERYARNGALVRLINKFPDPPNKDVGEGLNTAFEAMRKLRLKDPVIEQHANSVLVQIRHESLASPEDQVMEFLESNDRINNSKGRELCHIGSENVMKRVFERLIDRDLIERIPGLRGRAIAYQKKHST